MHTHTMTSDNTALNAIRLICTDDSEVGSAEGRRGEWTAEIRLEWIKTRLLKVIFYNDKVLIGVRTTEITSPLSR